MELNKILTEKTIKLNVKVANWQESIVACGKLLVDTGACNTNYVQAMIKSVKNVGPYIVIAPHIAMPHANDYADVSKVGFSLITLNEPIFFGNEKNDPVKIVICICSVDNNSHIQALSELASLLGKKGVAKSIWQARSVSEILKLLNN